MKVVEKSINKLHPYANNPRNNKVSIEYLVKSIQRFGFKLPCLVTAEGEIICGHSRYEAAKLLGMKKIPCVVADDMTEEQVRAFRLVDNKVGEKSAWDWDKLQKELQGITGIDMEAEFGFEKIDDVDIAPPEPKQKIRKGLEKCACTCPRCGRQFEVRHWILK